jgi:hypothetical protein
LRKRLNAPTFRLLNGLIEGGKTRPGEHAIGGEVIAVTTHALDELELALRMSGKRNVPDQMSEQQRSGGHVLKASTAEAVAELSYSSAATQPLHWRLRLLLAKIRITPAGPTA